MKTSITHQLLAFTKLLSMVLVIALILALLQSCEDPGSDIAPEEDLDTIMTDTLDNQSNEDQPINFDYFTEKADAVISDTTVYYYGQSVSNLKVKVYRCKDNTDSSRPMILLGAGGAYRKYNQVSQVQDICINLAKRGYVTGYYEYSLGEMNGETWLKSTQDLIVAIRHFKKYATEFGIDPDKIFSGGWSTGAQISMYAAYMSPEDYNNVDQEFIHQLLDAEIETNGYYPEQYAEIDSHVKGTVLLMPYVWDLDIFQADEPAVMMICNEKSTFSNGAKVWGSVSVNGVVNYGPNLMNDKFESLGYEPGKDLEFVITDPSLDSKWSYLNYTPLDKMYFDDIAGFLHRNLD